MIYKIGGPYPSIVKNLIKYYLAAVKDSDNNCFYTQSGDDGYDYFATAHFAVRIPKEHSILNPETISKQLDKTADIKRIFKSSTDEKVSVNLNETIIKNGNKIQKFSDVDINWSYFNDFLKNNIFTFTTSKNILHGYFNNEHIITIAGITKENLYVKR